jgi:hypothetical protein
LVTTVYTGTAKTLSEKHKTTTKNRTPFYVTLPYIQVQVQYITVSMSDPTTSYNNSSNSGRNQPAVLRGGGRTPGAGRHLYSPNNNANNNNKQQQPMDVHSGSGLPHGHVPAYLPGSASLVEELDQELLMILRDGRHVVGVSTVIVFKQRIEGLRVDVQLIYLTRIFTSNICFYLLFADTDKFRSL